MALTTNSNHTVLRGGGQGGHLYTGVEPIVVNNQEYKISANTAALGVESPLYFSVDTPTQTVISFSGDGQPYSAGENISVENHIISGKDWTPELDEKLDISALENLDVTPYSAGANINITDHIVSGKDWNPEINNASSYAYSEAIARIHETEYSAGPNINIVDHIVSGKDWTNEINSASANAVEEAKIQITAVASATIADSAYTANYALSSDSATYDSNGNIITATYLTAVTGDNTPYSAGANIDITDHIVSGKDWTSDIQAASANAASAGSAAATAWTDQQNYLTAHQDVTDLPYVQNSALDYTPGSHLVSSISGDGLYAMSAEGAFTAETANYSYVAETANYVADGWEYNASNEITGYSGSAFHAESPSEGKIYTGISPIVVDNSTTTGTISAQTARLGVQGPLYFVEDTSASTVIGISGLPEVEGVMYESALNFGDGYITGYNSSALSSERSRYAVSSTSANGAVSSQTAAIVTGGWETANGKITGYNGTAFNAGGSNPQVPVSGVSGISIEKVGDTVLIGMSSNYTNYNVSAGSNISVTTAGSTYTVSGKDWTNTITGASSYAYNQATANATGKYIPYTTITTGDSGTTVYNVASGIRVTSTSGWVELYNQNKENENEAHLQVGQNYTGNKSFWAELDGAGGGFLQLNWNSGTVGPNSHSSYSDGTTAAMSLGLGSLIYRSANAALTSFEDPEATKVYQLGSERLRFWNTAGTASFGPKGMDSYDSVGNNHWYTTATDGAARFRIEGSAGGGYRGAVDLTPGYINFYNDDWSLNQSLSVGDISALKALLNHVQSASANW